MGRTGGMPTSEWSIETPTSLEFDDVTGLRVRLIAGSVAVLATTGKPTLEVSSIEGDPLSVSYQDGVLGPDGGGRVARAPGRERGQRRRDRGPRPGPAGRDAGHHGVRRGHGQASGRSRRPGEPAFGLG